MTYPWHFQQQFWTLCNGVFPNLPNDFTTVHCPLWQVALGGMLPEAGDDNNLLWCAMLSWFFVLLLVVSKVKKRWTGKARLTKVDKISTKHDNWDQYINDVCENVCEVSKRTSSMRQSFLKGTKQLWIAFVWNFMPSVNQLQDYLGTSRLDQLWWVMMWLVRLVNCGLAKWIGFCCFSIGYVESGR